MKGAAVVVAMIALLAMAHAAHQQGALTGAESYSASSRRALKDVDVSYTTGDVTVDPAGVFVSGTTKDDTPYDVDVTKDPGAVGVFVG